MATTGAIRIARFGGPEVMEWQPVDLPEPGPGEARIRHTAIGLNFIDTYHRSGLYPLDLPAGLGVEAAGVVEVPGPGATGLKPGDRVAYVGPPPGAYAQARNFPAQRLVRLPSGVTDESAAASLLKGLTAWYLLFRSYALRSGDPVLVYAAAGGVGLILSQWGRHLGARVIGVVSTEPKAELARANGCAEVVMADDPDFVAHVREQSGGGVAAVYDSVGRDTFMQSLDCLRRHGTMVTYGNASGPVEPFSPLELSRRGSLFVTRPVLFDFIATPTELNAACAALFEVLTAGVVRVSINQRYALADAVRAHRELEARRTTGSSILLP